MRLVVSGSRSISDPQVVADALDRVNAQPPVTLVHGNARGVDRTAATIALARGWTVEAHPAPWATSGRAAGIIRNRQMIDTADHVLAIWDGRSKGTRHAINYATSIGKPLTVISPFGTAVYYTFSPTIATTHPNRTSDIRPQE